MYGLIETGEYYKWLKRRQNPNLPEKFLNNLRVLVVGGGSAGKRHLANVLGLGIENVAIVEPKEAMRREITERYGAVTTYTNEDEAYAAGKYDVVIVANPPIFHLESAKRALKAGAHMLIEKNISHTTAGVEVFLKQSDKAKKMVAVNCIYRFFDTLQYVKELLDSGAIGTVYSAQITFSESMLDWHSWEKPKDFYSSQKKLGGSELYGENHTIDFSRWFFGEIRDVSGYVGRIADVTVDADDFAELIFTHKNGVVSQHHLDAIGRKHRKDMWITGEKGTIFWDSYMGANRVEVYRADTKKTEVYYAKKTRNDAFVDLLVDFLECVRSGKRQPKVNGWEALKTLEASIVAEKAGKQGKRLKVN
jgi:predicted dehydrogenase